MTVPEAGLLLRDLNEHATQRQFVYVHKWTLHDLVMWDNRQTMHRVRRYDQSQPRDMRRATVAGTMPTVAQEAAEYPFKPTTACHARARPAHPPIFARALLWPGCL